MGSSSPRSSAPVHAEIGVVVPCRRVTETHRDYLYRLEQVVHTLPSPWSGVAAVRGLIVAMRATLGDEVWRWVDRLEQVIDPVDHTLIRCLRGQAADPSQWSLADLACELLVLASTLSAAPLRIELVLAMAPMSEAHTRDARSLQVYADLEPDVMSVGDAEQRSRFLNNRAATFAASHAYYDAMVDLRRAIALRRAAGMSYYIATSLMNLGMCARHLGDWSGAIEAIAEAIQLERAASSSPRLGRLYQNMVRILVVSGDREGAVQALSMARSMTGQDAAPGQAQAHLMVAEGLVHLLRGGHDEGLVCLQQAVDRKEPEVSEEAAGLLLVALTEHGHMERAERLVQRIFVDGAPLSASIRAYQLIGQAALHEHGGRLDEARQLLIAAEDLAERCGSVEVIGAAQRALVGFTERSGDLRETLNLLRSHQRAHDVRRARLQDAHVAAARAEQEVMAAVARADAAEASGDALAEATLRLRDEERARLRALGVLVHNLRNPLTALLGMAELLREQLAADGLTELVRYPAAVLHASGQMSRHIDGLMQDHHEESRSPAWVPGGVDLIALVREVAIRFTPVAGERGQRLTLRCDGVRVRVPGDDTMIVEILGHLVSNALAFSAEGATVEIELAEDDAHVYLAVHDQGVGIAVHDMERIMARQITASRGAPSGGPEIGLGLFTVTRLADRLGVGVDVRSTVGKGTSVSLSFSKPGGSVRDTQTQPLIAALDDGCVNT